MFCVGPYLVLPGNVMLKDRLIGRVVLTLTEFGWSHYCFTRIGRIFSTCWHIDNFFILFLILFLCLTSKTYLDASPTILLADLETGCGWSS